MVDEQTDIAVDYDYYDPDDDPVTDNVEGEFEATEGDTDEVPAEELEAEAEQDADEENPEEETESEDDPVIDLGDEKVPLSQLKEERMRQQDYSRKTAEVAREREAVKQSQQFYSQQTQQLNSLLQETVNFLQDVIPEEPPLSLAQSNPSQYQYQKELRSRAMAEINQLVQKSQKVKQSQSQTQQFQSRETVQQHIAGLERRFPHLKGDNQKLVNFVNETRKKAIEEFGVSPQIANQATDDTLLELVHYASLGKKAEHNRNNAKRRLSQPKKAAGRPATGAKGGNSNRKAMQRLSQTGSLRDALAVDFD